ncbi:hypothetical protein Ga0061079_105134 [Apibacter mensalis]|uniref:Uncharacterized protein n=1 Tax=Apibacter mensalis TaxID=1586267 RepID=A0A0X3AQ59_9FLAO|nr:hypothetical protein [Apibacter mensalis]CVK16175.1 hypothetical protein Ga0061079_105134 [Apibacter mensalis]
MRIKTKVTIGLFIIIIGLSLKYLDLCVSDKYEAQLEGLSPTEQQIKKAKELKSKIERDKKIVLTIIIISSLFFYPIYLMKRK